MSRELRAKVEEYLRIRRALGFKLDDHARSLSAFIDHLESIGASTPTVEAALQWATAAAGRATVPVEATTVGGARIRPLPARA